MIKLDKIYEEDLEIIRKWRMSKHVSQYMLTDPIITTESQKIWYQNINQLSDNYYWIIKDNNVRIGYISLTNFNYKSKTYEAGHYIGEPAYLRKGISKIVEANLYDFVFDTLNLEKLIFTILKENQAAYRLHKSLGAISYELEVKSCIKHNKSHELIGQCMTKDLWFSIRNQLDYPKIIIEI